MTRRRETTALTAICAILFALATASCGSADGEAGGGSTAHSAVTNTSPAPTPADIEPRTDLAGTHSIPWQDPEIVADRQIRVHFTGGDPRCYGYNATVKETSTTIAITVLEGSVSDSKTLCYAIGINESLLVDLDAPVAGRKIVHG